MKAAVHFAIQFVIICTFSQSTMAQTVLFRGTGEDGSIYTIYLENGQCIWNFGGIECVVSQQDSILKGVFANSGDFFFLTRKMNDVYVEATFSAPPTYWNKYMVGSIFYEMSLATLEHYGIKLKQGEGSGQTLPQRSGQAPSALTWVLLLLIIGTSFWVLFDARIIGLKKGQISGLADMGPLGWFLACLLIWIIAFPLYLSKRHQFKELNSKIRDMHGTGKAPLQVSDFEVMEQLLQLKGKGVISEEEFQRKKKELLNA